MDKGLKYGSKLVQELQTYYNGTSEVMRCKQVTRYDIRKTFYKNETTFKLYKYITKLNGIFNVMEDFRVTFYE